MKTEFRYWLDTDISVNPSGIFLDEAAGNRFKVYLHCTGPRISIRRGEPQIDAKRIMAEAFLGRSLAAGEQVRFIKWSDLRLDNLVLLKSYNAPMTLYTPEGDMEHFATVADAAGYLAQATGRSKASLRLAVRNTLSGAQPKVRSHHILLDEDIDFDLDDPWNFRPIDQLDYKHETMRTFKGITELIEGLSLPPQVGPTSIRRKIRGVLKAGSKADLRILGYRIAYRSEHLRRVPLIRFL